MKRIALLASALATPAMAVPNEYGHMMDWGYGSGFGMFFGSILWLVVLGLIVVGIVWLVRRMDGEAPHKKQSTAIVELDLRFARGEIDAEEYATRKKLLNN